MRIRGIVVILASFGAVEAQASSIVVAAPFVSAPSIQSVGSNASTDTSIIDAAPPADTPSMTVMRGMPTGPTPSIVSVGTPAELGAESETMPSHRVSTPVVFRAGEVSQTAVRASTGTPAASAPASATAPLLDPDDRGTARKRKALKRQAEELAREKANGGEPAAAAPQPTPDS